ncbi:MAG: DUF4157 domain-containing protein [Proteobacteria bacterium]|nr:DUF4157 domain-containing protein [Pseudomonadota bacterium]MCP4919995.1 DUF4157 domain-containing protein [Pseudomonadota bacterium]
MARSIDSRREQAPQPRRSETTQAGLPGITSIEGRPGPSNDQLAGALFREPQGPNDLYLRHLANAELDLGVDVSAYMPGVAPSSWVQWVQPYYNVLWAESQRAPEVAGPSVDVHRDADGSDPAADLETFLAELNQVSAGRPLSAEERRLVKGIHGRELPEVRIHDDARSRRLARSISARAFTTETDIYYAIDSRLTDAASAELLAHETTHVVQHLDGRLPKAKADGLTVSRPGDMHEREAERFGRLGKDLYERARAWGNVAEDPWGLLTSAAEDDAALAIIEQIASDLPATDTRPPEELVREGLEILLDDHTNEAVEGLDNVLAEDGDLHDLPGEMTLEDGLNSYRNQSASMIGTSNEALAERMGFLGTPSADDLVGLGHTFAPYPEFATAAAEVVETAHVARKSDGGVADAEHPAVQRALRSRRSGAPLPKDVREELEQRFKTDFSAVRIHDNQNAHSASAALKAKAFTTGQDIYFSAGRFDTSSTEGRQLLAHELTHVVQNQQASMAESSEGTTVENETSSMELEATQSESLLELSGRVSQATDGAEFEARAAADAALAGEDVVVQEAPSAGLARDGDTPPVNAPRSLRRFDTATVGGGQFVQEGGRWKVVPGAANPPLDQEFGVNATLLSASTPEESGRPEFGDTETGGAHGSAGGNHAEAHASLSAGASTAFGYYLNADAGASYTAVDGELVLQTPKMSFSIGGERLQAQLGVRFTAAVALELQGNVRASINEGEGGVSAHLGAFAGAKAGVQAFMDLEWAPVALGSMIDVAGLSYGVEGYAGAAAAAQLSCTLYPSVKVAWVYGAAWGLGAATKGIAEINLERMSMLALTLAGRGVSAALDGLEMTWLARGLDRMLDELYEDDAARAAVELGLHRDLPVARRIILINKMLNGATGNDDEAAIVTIFRDAADTAEIRRLAYGATGGVLGLIENFHGDEHGELMAILYTDGNMTDIPIDDNVARELIRLDIHQQMDLIRVRRLVHALNDGFTGNSDEQAILRIFKERSDWAEVFNQTLINACLSNFHGDEYDALAGFLYLNDRLPDGDLDDDIARAIVRHGLHTAVTSNTKLRRLIDALISGATGDDDEYAIVRILMDCPDFCRSLPSGTLEDCLDDCDGSEYEDLLVAIRKGGRLSLSSRRIRGDIDDNVARKLVREGVHTQLSVAECTIVIDELLSGATGNDDEAAIIQLLVDRQADATRILPTRSSRQEVMDDCNGEEHDEILALFCVYDMWSGIDIDDDVARAIVRLGLHTRITDGPFLWTLISEMLSGMTGDDDEDAILAILRDCPLVKGQLTPGRLEEIGDDLHGEQYESYIVWARTDGILASVTESWVDLHDDVARAVIDQVDMALYSHEECQAMVRALNDGFTGDADEARLLALIRGRTSDVFTGKTDPLINTVIANVHGEEETSLFVLLFQNDLLVTDPWHEDFDDNAAREFINRGFHRDATRINSSACRLLCEKMIEGMTGNADEAALFKIVDARPEIFTGADDLLVNQIIADTHGEDETLLFELLYLKDLFSTAPLHPEFDDNAARLFVDKGYHTDGGRWTADACVKLIDHMLEGFTGDDDETRILQILRTRNDSYQALTDAKVTLILDNMHGDEELEAFAGFWQAGDQELVLNHEDFDDDIARDFITKGFHTSMTGEQAVKLLDAMIDGATLNDDEDNILRLFREAPQIFDQLSTSKLQLVLTNFDGDQWDTLFLFLYKAGKGGTKPINRELFPSFDDNTARLFVDDGASMSAGDMAICVTVMLEGATTNDDEARILTLYRDNWSVLGAPESTAVLNRVAGDLHGDEYDQFTALLWEHNRLSPQIVFDDELARGIVLEGLYRGKSPAQCKQVLDALLEGATGNGDETAILTLLRDRTDLISGLSTTEVRSIISNLHGDEDAEVVVLFWSHNKIELSDDAIDDNAAREIVRQGLHGSMPAEDKASLVAKMLAGQCSDDDELAILQILRESSGSVGDIVAGVSLDELIGDFQFQNYYELVGLLYDSNVQRDVLVETHLNSNAAEWLVENDKLGSWSQIHKGTLASKLVYGDEGRALIRLYRGETASIQTWVGQVGMATIRARLSSDERAEIMQLIWDHATTFRQDILTNATGAEAERLVRAQVYTDLNASDRLLLMERCIGANLLDDAFEICQFAHGAGNLDALSSAAGGDEALIGKFRGTYADDLRNLLDG